MRLIPFEDLLICLRRAESVQRHIDSIDFVPTIAMTGKVHWQVKGEINLETHAFTSKLTSLNGDVSERERQLCQKAMNTVDMVRSRFNVLRFPGTNKFEYLQSCLVIKSFIHTFFKKFIPIVKFRDEKYNDITNNLSDADSAYSTLREGFVKELNQYKALTDSMNWQLRELLKQATTAEKNMVVGRLMRETKLTRTQVEKYPELIETFKEYHRLQQEISQINVSFTDLVV